MSTPHPMRDRRSTRRALLALAVAGLVTVVTLPLTAQQAGTHWVGTWATAEVGRPQYPPAPATPPGGAPAQAPQQPAPFLHFTNQTVRQVVRVSAGGPRVRVVLSNVYGTAPVTIGAAQIGVREKDAAIAAGSNRALTFSGQPTIAIPSGALMFSDPVDLTVPPLADVVIDLYLPGTTNVASALTMHNGALQTNYISGTGNFAGAPSFQPVATTQSWFLLARVEVMAPQSVGTIVAFGDSITDGSRSTPTRTTAGPIILHGVCSRRPRPWRSSTLASAAIGCSAKARSRPASTPWRASTSTPWRKRA